MASKKDDHRKQSGNRNSTSHPKLNKQLYKEIEKRFGLLPNFFKPAPENPEVTRSLWGFALFAYLDNPLPSLFKERLFVYLSRFCKKRYCVTRHLGFLVGLGHPSGDNKILPQPIHEVINLLERTLPRGAKLENVILELSSLSSPFPELTKPGSYSEEQLFACAAHVFLQSSSAQRCLAALEKVLDPSCLQYLLLFLAFVRTAHFWSEVQSNLHFENDISELLETNQDLAQLLLEDPELKAVETSRVYMQELESLRLSKRLNEKLLEEEQLLHQKQEENISKATAELDHRIVELEKANKEVRESRRAALNLMEDAILSREALRINEERMRKLKEALQSAINGAEIEDSLSIIASLVSEELNARAAFYIADGEGQYLHPVYGGGNMPDSYLDEVDGFRVGEDSIAYGLAIPTGRPVLTADVFKETLWIPWLYLAEKYQFRGCWSFPIKTRNHKPVGTFALYFTEPREAKLPDLSLADLVTQTAAIIISQNIETEERIQAEDALRKSEARLKITMNSATDYAIITMNADRKIERWSAGAEKAFGYKEEDVIGQPADIIYTEKDRESHIPEKEMETARDKGRASDDRWHVRRDGSKFFMSGIMAPIHDGGLSGYVKVARDMTEQKLLEQHKDEFIGIASHELKTPVTSIKAYGEYLNHIFTKEENFENAELVAKLNSQVDRLTGLINSLLDTTRISDGQLSLSFEKFSLNDLIEERVVELQRTTENHRILFSAAEDVEVVADKERIAQVLTNLISNAIKYSNGGSDVNIGLEKTDHTARVSVKDEGIGIAEELRDKIFERFYRVNDSKLSTYPGMGLGLYITASIVKRHKGKIWVESKLNEGSVFYFLLPYDQNSE